MQMIFSFASPLRSDECSSDWLDRIGRWNSPSHISDGLATIFNHMDITLDIKSDLQSLQPGHMFWQYMLLIPNMVETNQS